MASDCLEVQLLWVGIFTGKVLCERQSSLEGEAQYVCLVCMGRLHREGGYSVGECIPVC